MVKTIKTFRVFGNAHESVWDLLGPVCEDNGDVCVGNALIANPYDEDLSDVAVAQAAAEGYGEIIEVEEAFGNDQMLKVLGLPAREDPYAEWDHEEIEAMQEAATAQLQWWSYYGSSGEWYFTRK